MGLRPGHHGELNRGHVRRSRFEELRAQYRDDPVALQYINAYDGTTPYYTHMKALIGAWGRNDEETIAREEAWLKQHYPDIK